MRKAVLQRSLVLFLLACGLLASHRIYGQLAPIPTPRHPATNTYHGKAVTDDYQWLEDSTGSAVREWTRQQNERTATYLGALPFRSGISAQLEELISEQPASYSISYLRRGTYFGLRNKPPAQQPVLVSFKSLYSPALRQVVFDPNQWNTNGTVSMDWYVPSPDGRVVAISLSENGSEDGTLHFFDTATGRHLTDEIPCVQYPTGGGSAAWNAEGTGIFYTRYPKPGERPEADLHFYQQIWFHRLGTPISADTFELGRDFPRIAEIELESSEDGQWLLAAVANGDGGEFAHYLRSRTSPWRQITRFEDGIKRIKFGRNSSLYLLSTKGAPRGKILRLPAEGADLSHAETVVSQRPGVIEDYAAADHGLYVIELEGGPSRMQFFPGRRGPPPEVPIFPVSSVGGLACWNGDECVFVNNSFTEPASWFTWQPGAKEPRRTAFHQSSPTDFDDVEVVREFATSKDGTKVPMSILRKKGLSLDGTHPTLLTGYGGYGISLAPTFRATRRIWFDAGGVFVVANLRGGGEFGEEWHLAGNLVRKQNVFDDFIACAEHLIKRKYTTSAKLAVEGGSNGGLLMGAFMAQRPELARAVVSHVGIYDMLRVELDPNGVFNITEFGTVNDPVQFQAIYNYSPFHHVKDGVQYPAVLFTAGENDGRVNPAQSRKMTARLQATGSQRPILLRTSASAGHGIGSSLRDRVSESADVYAFLFNELGIDASPWIVSNPKK